MIRLPMNEIMGAEIGRGILADTTKIELVIHYGIFGLIFLSLMGLGIIFGDKEKRCLRIVTVIFWITIISALTLAATFWLVEKRLVDFRG